MDYAIQLLEGIGAISKSDSRKASESGNYQDLVIAPISHEHDNTAVVNRDELEDEEDELQDAISEVSPSIDKVS